MTNLKPQSTITFHWISFLRMLHLTLFIIIFLFSFLLPSYLSLPPPPPASSPLLPSFLPLPIDFSPSYLNISYAPLSPSFINFPFPSNTDLPDVSVILYPPLNFTTQRRIPFIPGTLSSYPSTLPSLSSLPIISFADNTLCDMIPDVDEWNSLNSTLFPYDYHYVLLLSIPFPFSLSFIPNSVDNSLSNLQCTFQQQFLRIKSLPFVSPTAIIFHSDGNPIWPDTHDLPIEIYKLFDKNLFFGFVNDHDVNDIVNNWEQYWSAYNAYQYYVSFGAENQPPFIVGNNTLSSYYPLPSPIIALPSPTPSSYTQLALLHAISLSLIVSHRVPSTPRYLSLYDPPLLDPCTTRYSDIWCDNGQIVRMRFNSAEYAMAYFPMEMCELTALRALSVRMDNGTQWQSCGAINMGIGGVMGYCVFGGFCSSDNPLAASSGDCQSTNSNGNTPYVCCGMDNILVGYNRGENGSNNKTYNGMQIPECIGQLRDLRYLDMSNSATLYGSIPYSLSTLPLLSYININESPHLTGPLPFYSLLSLPSLLVLALHNTAIEDILHDTHPLWSHQRLMYVDCGLGIVGQKGGDGSISTFLSYSSYQNRWGAMVNPYCSYTLSPPETVALSLKRGTMSIKGRMPNNMTMVSLRYINFDSQVLAGGFPYYDISNGAVGMWISLPVLTYVFLSNNDLEGNLSSLTYSPHIRSSPLISLCLNNNNIEGPLPPMGRSSSLQIFDISNNLIRADIYPLLHNMIALQLVYMNISYNQISGEMVCNQTYSSLQVWDASSNNLSFPSYDNQNHQNLSGGNVDIPITMGLGHLFATCFSPLYITYIDFSYNNLRCQWQENQTYPFLSTINVEYNDILSIPALILSHFPSLSTLILSHNVNLVGSFPIYAFPFVFLTTFHAISTPLLTSYIYTVLGFPVVVSASPFQYPFWFSPNLLVMEKQQPEWLFTCPVWTVRYLDNIFMTSTWIFDPTFYSYEYCVCDSGYFGNAPQCVEIPSLMLLAPCDGGMGCNFSAVSANMGSGNSTVISNNNNNNNLYPFLASTSVITMSSLPSGFIPSPSTLLLSDRGFGKRRSMSGQNTLFYFGHYENVDSSSSGGSSLYSSSTTAAFTGDVMKDKMMEGEEVVMVNSNSSSITNNINSNANNSPSPPPPIMAIQFHLYINTSSFSVGSQLIIYGGDLWLTGPQLLLLQGIQLQLGVQNHLYDSENIILYDDAPQWIVNQSRVLMNDQNINVNHWGNYGNNSIDNPNISPSIPPSYSPSPTPHFLLSLQRTTFYYTTITIYNHSATLRFVSPDISSTHFYINSTFLYECPYPLTPISYYMENSNPFNPDSTINNDNNNNVLDTQCGVIEEISLPLTISLITLCTLVTLLIFALMIYIYIHRTDIIFRSANTPFCLLLLFFCSTLSAGSLFNVITPHTNQHTGDGAICDLRVWFFVLPFLCVISIIVGRAAHIHSLFYQFENNSKVKGRRQVMSSKQLMGGIFILIFIQIIMLIIYSAIGFSPSTLTVLSSVPYLTFTSSCYPFSWYNVPYTIWLSVQFFYWCLLLITAMRLAYLVRNLPSAFNESSHLAYCIFASIMIFALLAPLNLVLNSSNLMALAILRVVGLNLLTMIFVVTIFGPKILYVIQGRGNDKRLLEMGRMGTSVIGGNQNKVKEISSSTTRNNHTDPSSTSKHPGHINGPGTDSHHKMSMSLEMTVRQSADTISSARPKLKKTQSMIVTKSTPTVMKRKEEGEMGRGHQEHINENKSPSSPSASKSTIHSPSITNSITSPSPSSPSRYTGPADPNAPSSSSSTLSPPQRPSRHTRVHSDDIKGISMMSMTNLSTPPAPITLDTLSVCVPDVVSRLREIYEIVSEYHQNRHQNIHNIGKKTVHHPHHSPLSPSALSSLQFLESSCDDMIHLMRRMEMENPIIEMSVEERGGSSYLTNGRGEGVLQGNMNINFSHSTATSRITSNEEAKEEISDHNNMTINIDHVGVGESKETQEEDKDKITNAKVKIETNDSDSAFQSTGKSHVNDSVAATSSTYQRME